MSDLRKLAAQAMEYLASFSVGESPNASAVNDLIADLEAALAQPEPAAWSSDPEFGLKQGWTPPKIEQPEQEPKHRTMIEHFILGLADEAIQNPGASIHDLIGRLGYVHKTKLPKPEQEPVAWMWKAQTDGVHTTSGIGFHKTNLPGVVYTPLYTAQPQRKPLTDEEINKIADDGLTGYDRFTFSRAIEAAHGIGGES
jgi:hypothetical protein